MGRPSRAPYLVGVAVALGGFAVVMAAAVIASLVAFFTSIDSFPRVVVPGEAQLNLPAGEYTIYSEQPGRSDGATLGKDAVAGLSCRLTDPSGRPVTVRTPLGSTSYTVNAHSGVSLFVFQALTDGRYQLACDYGQQNGPSTVLAFDRAGTSLGVVALVSGIGTSAAGLVVCALVYLRRRRWARATPTAAPATSLVSLMPPVWPEYEYPAAPQVQVSMRPGGSARRTAVSVVTAVSAVCLLATAGVAAALVPPHEDGTVLAAGTSAPQANPTQNSTEPTVVPFDQIRSGDCLNEQSSSTNEAVSRMPCTIPHDTEVHDIVDLGGGPWPGARAVSDRASQLCSVAAGSFIGIPADQTQLDLSWYEPVEEGWESGDHTVICVVADPDGKTTGTLRGSRR